MSDAVRLGRSATCRGLGRSKPGVVRWLGDIRRYFPTPVVQILQRDAVERLDLRQLLLEPELLRSVEPDIHLVTLLVELNRLLPDETRATARQVIEQVLADLQARLTDQTRQAVRGSLARSARTRRPRAGDVDWPRTISANLRNWVPEHQAMVPERLVGHGRRQPSLARDVVIAVDQSGSMADSVVYASLFAAVLAQLPTLRTRFVVFDTAVTDLTRLPPRPGRGALRGAARRRHGHLERTGVLPGPDRSAAAVRAVPGVGSARGWQRALMYRRVGELVSSGVHVVVLLALSDEGVPAYDHTHAEALTSLGATVLATTPDEFPDVLATRPSALTAPEPSCSERAAARVPARWVSWLVSRKSRVRLAASSASRRIARSRGRVTSSSTRWTMPTVTRRVTNSPGDCSPPARSAAVHVMANIVTVDLVKGHDSTGLADVVRDLYQYWHPGMEPPVFDEESADEADARVRLRPVVVTLAAVTPRCRRRPSAFRRICSNAAARRAIRWAAKYRRPQSPRPLADRTSVRYVVIDGSWLSI